MCTFTNIYTVKENIVLQPAHICEEIPRCLNLTCIEPVCNYGLVTHLGKTSNLK